MCVGDAHDGQLSALGDLVMIVGGLQRVAVALGVVAADNLVSVEQLSVEYVVSQRHTRVVPACGHPVRMAEHAQSAGFADLLKRPHTRGVAERVHAIGHGAELLGELGDLGYERLVVAVAIEIDAP